MSKRRIVDENDEPTPYWSIYDVISEAEYAEKSDSSYSYFPCYVLGENPETGKKENVLSHYAKHKYEKDWKMNMKQAAELAMTVNTGRKDLIAYLRGVNSKKLAAAAAAAKLPRFPYKLRCYPGDITTAMLAKVTAKLVR
jgi:hypothetical protein